MHYETIMHERRPVRDAAEAATIIHEGQQRDYDALCWTASNGREMCAVGDNHCNNTWGEVAIIDLGRKVQIESITFDWVKTLEEKIGHLVNCETTDFTMGRIDGLPIDGEGGNTPAYFECSCCGTSFRSTYSQQKQYDQDNGYGLCRECRRY